MIKFRVGKYQDQQVDKVEDYSYLKWVASLDWQSSAFTVQEIQAAREKAKAIDHYGK